YEPDAKAILPKRRSAKRANSCQYGANSTHAAGQIPRPLRSCQTILKHRRQVGLLRVSGPAKNTRGKNYAEENEKPARSEDQARLHQHYIRNAGLAGLRHREVEI